jgi:hypothetical protein
MNHRVVHILLGLPLILLSLLPSIPTTAMSFRPGSCDTRHRSKIWLPHEYIYILVSCGRVLLFALSAVHRDNLGFTDHNSNYTVRLG